MKFYRDLFDASLSRIFPQDDKAPFFNAFYEKFIHMSPETERHFQSVNADELRRLIHKTLFAMLAVDGSLFVPDFLESLARDQGSRGIRLPPGFFALWRLAMLNTVRERDPQCDEEVLTAWAMSIAPGLEYLRRQAELHYQAGGRP
ncbi:MAG TPA: globin [Franconibacter helveticus]|uniref:globin n=1 Tax=Franconibacter helveticus TaxID=357240 RepID=UPI0004041AB6|nr:globin [Franconibacter helveticus]MDU6926289.1 globin [Franconibacter helveticus]HAZ55142.1 globin [Franconibacter helveticus]